MNDQDWLAERFEDNRPRPARCRLPDARLPDRGRRRRPGGMDPPEPHRPERRRQPAGGLVDDGRRSGLPQDVAIAKTRRELSAGIPTFPDPIVSPEEGMDPEQEALLAIGGLAMLVVLDSLAPA